MPSPGTDVLYCLSNCSTAIYYYGNILTFGVETGRKLNRGDTKEVCAEAQNGYDRLQEDQAVCINTNGAIFVNGKQMTNRLPTITSWERESTELSYLTLKL